MKTLTMSSEEFRMRWGESIDKVLRGYQVVIERYKRPTVVMVPYEQHAAMQQRLAELEQREAEQEFSRQFAAIRAGDYVELTLDDIERIDREVTGQP
jgi:antitoxin (DNA-binding transcriptional repressor) of toxin-antitoxin stability system